ncbi:hypothetical protein [Rhizobium sp. LjRoot254]|uniref:hypothetical protein n=1 Tax=Rhizobium sp. LjRoot254 TaxID=3342297 RepID=UPI003ED071C9
MSNVDELFDLNQVEAITSDLRLLCQDLADRLHASDLSAALEFADSLRSQRISAHTFVEWFRENMIQRLNPPARTRMISFEGPIHKTH